ncbi:MAG: pantetheine-phosphate adenylyltransferase [Succinivibrio sp.]
MNRLAVFPGTFDPLTKGHLDIIRRSNNLFDRLIIAVAKSPSKHTLFDLEQRVSFCRTAVMDLPNVSVIGFEGMLIDFLKEVGANILIRGIRTVSDYDYETQLVGMYTIAMPELEVVMLPTKAELSFISSTLVREVLIHKGDIAPFIPESILSAIKQSKF